MLKEFNFSDLSLDNQSILITGGTGSFGQACVHSILKHYTPERLIVYSRDETKQFDMSNEYNARLEENSPLRFFIGDVRDIERLKLAMVDVDIVIHAAALKHVPIAEYNPMECIRTNVNGAENIVMAALECGISKVIALSTDKAANPVNLYGASTLAADQSFVAGNNLAGKRSTRFSVVRYGNVLGSRGSVLPFFRSLIKDGASALPVTDERMTRFMISLEQGVELVWKALDNSVGGEIYVKKIPSMGILDIAKAVKADAEFDIVGIRPGEKLHEQMIGSEDAPFTYEYGSYFKILPQINDWFKDEKRIGSGVLVNKNFEYSSNTNQEWMSVEKLRNWITINFNKFGTF